MGRYAESVSGTSRSYGHYGVGCLQLAYRLGGLTGDTYGALNEMIESVLLFACLGGINGFNLF